MSVMQKILLVYFAAVSILSAVITVHDKHAAVRHRYRMPERTLLLLSAIGGSAAMYFTMKCIRHKTKHPKFMTGIPIIMILQVLLFGLFWHMNLL